MQQLSDVGARCALNHDTGGTLSKEAYQMQKDNHDDRNACQPQHQVTEHHCPSIC
jgi:hypothetical protein